MYIGLLAIVADRGKSSLDMDNDLGASHFCARSAVVFFSTFFFFPERAEPASEKPGRSLLRGTMACGEWRNCAREESIKCSRMLGTMRVYNITYRAD